MDLDAQFATRSGSEIQAEIGPFIARITSPAPAAASDPLFVVINSFDGGRHDHGPCLWEPPAGGLPAVGEVCVVVRAIEEDGEGEQTVVIAFDRDTSPAGGATGPAGGVLSGTYPDPGFAVDMATQVELNAAVAAHAASNAHFLPGDLKATARATAPAEWLICDGAVVSRTTYAALFAAIGTVYNTGGEPGTDFRLPNLKGRVPVGRDAAQTEFDVLGESGGGKTHTLTTPQIPAHSHPVAPSSSFYRFVGAGGTNTIAAGTVLDAVPITTQNAGGGGAHNNLQPYQVINYLIYAGV